MHSSLVRVQNVFGFFTSVTFVVGALIALSALLFPTEPGSVNIDVTNFRVYVETHRLPECFNGGWESADNPRVGRRGVSDNTMPRNRMSSHLLTSISRLVLTPPSPHLFSDVHIEAYIGEHVDLNPLFNWNTKQVFAYVSVSYPGKKFVRSLFSHSLNVFGPLAN